MDAYMKRQERIQAWKRQYAHLVGKLFVHKTTGEAYFVTGIHHNVEYGMCVTNGAWSIRVQEFLEDYEQVS